MLQAPPAALGRVTCKRRAHTTILVYTSIMSALTSILLSVLVLMSGWVSSGPRELLAAGACRAGGGGRRLGQEACGATPGAYCCCQPVQGILT